MQYCTLNFLVVIKWIHSSVAKEKQKQQINFQITLIFFAKKLAAHDFISCLMLIILFRRKAERITHPKVFFFNLNLNQIKALITKEKNNFFNFFFSILLVLISLKTMHNTNQTFIPSYFHKGQTKAIIIGLIYYDSIE